MPGAIALLVFVTLQRLAELVWNRGNERGLRARGAVEAGSAHYPVMVALHSLWLVALWLWGWDRPLVWAWLVIYVLLQLGRTWVLVTLGRRWTTRVFVVPGEDAGPPRPVPLRHPSQLRRRGAGDLRPAAGVRALGRWLCCSAWPTSRC